MDLRTSRMEAREPKSEEESWFEVEGERDTTESVGSALKTDRRESFFTNLRNCPLS